MEDREIAKLSSLGNSYTKLSSEIAVLKSEVVSMRRILEGDGTTSIVERLTRLESSIENIQANQIARWQIVGSLVAAMAAIAAGLLANWRVSA